LALTSLGTSVTMYAGAGVTLIGFLACLAWAEETRHRSLEQTGASETAAAEPAGVSGR
jgi:putative MFS transporter